MGRRGDSGRLQERQDDQDRIALLELRARLVDEKIIGEFLKHLVVNYSRMERRLAELVREKNYLMGMAAHDIRNPLISIRGFADLLLDGAMGGMNGEQKEILSLISTTSDGLLGLLNDLLDLSAVSEGVVRLEKKREDFFALAASRVRLMRPIARQKNLEIEEISDAGEAFLWFDSGKISQVMDNLLSNAVKFSFGGGTIRVVTGCADKGAFFEVRDAGPGIPADEEARLFAPFTTLSARGTAGEKSTGLGLFIAKRIVDTHGGEIAVKNGEAGGAAFAFRLPMEER